MVYKFCDKKSASGSGVANNEIRQYLQLAENLHKQLLETLQKEQFIQI